MLQTLEYIKKIYAKNRLSLISTYFLAVAVIFPSSYLLKIFNIQNPFISTSIHLFFDLIPIFLITYLIFKIQIIFFIEKYDFKVSKKPFLTFILFLIGWQYFSLSSILLLKILYFFLIPLWIKSSFL